MSNELYDGREFLPLDYRRNMGAVALLTAEIELPENIELGEN